MILEGHAIKITKSKDFKDLLNSEFYRQLVLSMENNFGTIFYCYYNKCINEIDYAIEEWVNKQVKIIKHDSLKDYYKYINPIINYTDI